MGALPASLEQTDAGTYGNIKALHTAQHGNRNKPVARFARKTDAFLSLRPEYPCNGPIELDRIKIAVRVGGGADY